MGACRTDLQGLSLNATAGFEAEFCVWIQGFGVWGLRVFGVLGDLESKCIVGLLDFPFSCNGVNLNNPICRG